MATGRDLWGLGLVPHPHAGEHRECPQSQEIKARGKLGNWLQTLYFMGRDWGPKNGKNLLRGKSVIVMNKE